MQKIKKNFFIYRIARLFRVTAIQCHRYAGGGLPSPTLKAACVPHFGLFKMHFLEGNVKTIQRCKKE